jgi:hypothetical protein
MAARTHPIHYHSVCIEVSCLNIGLLNYNFNYKVTGSHGSIQWTFALSG